MSFSAFNNSFYTNQEFLAKKENLNFVIMDSWRDNDEEDEVEISDFNAGGKGEIIFNSFVDLE